MLDLPSWLSGLIRWLSCLAQAAWVRLPLLPAYRVTFLHAMRLNSGAAIEASVLLNYDRPSHPDWGRLGVVRATGVDNRWQVPAALLAVQGLTIDTLPEKPTG